MLRSLNRAMWPNCPPTSKIALSPSGPRQRCRFASSGPRAAKGTLPVVMYFHGGGWVLGDHDTHDRLVREIAVGAAAAAVFVNYTPSPEAQYPGAPSSRPTPRPKWVAKHGQRNQPRRLAPGRRRRQRRRQHGRRRRAAGQGARRPAHRASRCCSTR